MKSVSSKFMFNRFFFRNHGRHLLKSSVSDSPHFNRSTRTFKVGWNFYHGVPTKLIKPSHGKNMAGFDPAWGISFFFLEWWFIQLSSKPGTTAFKLCNWAFEELREFIGNHEAATYFLLSDGSRRSIDWYAPSFRRGTRLRHFTQPGRKHLTPMEPKNERKN